MGFSDSAVDAAFKLAESISRITCELADLHDLWEIGVTRIRREERPDENFIARTEFLQGTSKR
jgi:hypothetical protein